MNLLHPLLVFLSLLTQQDLARQVVFLREENRILRSRLPGGVVATPTEKSQLIKLGRDLGVKLRELISIVSCSTFRRWIRDPEAAHVAREQPRQPTGRPRTASDIRELVLKLARENSWGYTRILGELRKLGIESISRSTVKAILKEHHIAPAPDRPRGSWSEFIRIHAATLVQCDFLSKPVWTPKGLVTLYVLAFIHIGSRRLWLSLSTRKPDTAWVKQQAERFMTHASATGVVPWNGLIGPSEPPIDSLPARSSSPLLPSPSGRGAGSEGRVPTGILLRDNDVKYPRTFDEVFRNADINVPKMPPRAPNLRAHVERVIQTMQSEVLDGMVVVGEKHFNHILSVTQDWYNTERSHSARDHLPPGWDKPPELDNTATPSEIVCTTHLGGLLNSYSRRAA